MVFNAGRCFITHICRFRGSSCTVAGYRGAFRDAAGASSRFNLPEGLWSDGTNLYVADTGNAVIRKIAIASGQVTTFAGKPQQRDVFNRPQGLWGDETSLYVTDGNVIRTVDLATGNVRFLPTPGMSRRH